MSNVSMIDGHIDRYKEMTSKEIIDGFCYCLNNSVCDDCVLKSEICDASLPNKIEVLKMVSEVLCSQHAEIEKLNVELVGMRGACNSYKMHYDNAKAEIERLNIRLRKERHQFEDVSKMYSEIRAEAIKEFAERFVNNLPSDNDCNSLIAVGLVKTIIQNVKKEMVGEEK